MPYYPSLTFTSGQILGASQLSQLSDNAGWFAGLSEFVVPPFNSQAIGSEHYMYRLHRYLHWKFSIPSGGSYSSYIKFYIEGVEIYSHTSGLTGPSTLTGSIDFNSDDFDTSANNWYHITSAFGGVAGNAATIWYIAESDTNTLSAGSGSVGTYAPPKQWVPTEVPTAAEMNKYSAAQNEINTRMGAYALNFAVGRINGGYFGVFCHRDQWLHYRSDNSPGALTDINGNNSVSLPGTVNTYNVYNLDTISWMTPGVFYRVSGVTMAAELSQP